MRSIQLGLWMVLAMVLVACGSDPQPPPAVSLGSRLTDSVSFRVGELIAGDLPQQTDSAIDLIELGPATLLLPGGTQLLAFEMTDDDARAPAAILLQFEDADSHLRGEVEEGGGASINVVSEELRVDDMLCQGLCDGVLTVDARAALELEGGTITRSIALQIAIDCRGRGTAGACMMSGGSAEPELVCEAVTEGGAALTGDPVLDAYLDAVRTLAVYSELSEERASDALTDVREALELGATDSIATELEMRIADATESGLQVLVGDPGCSIRTQRVAHTLRVCDRSLIATAPAVSCQGLCQAALAPQSCAQAEATGCLGVVQEVECAGECIGACQRELAEPGECGGTCIGTCDGACPDGGAACEGPCGGVCEGECREPISGECPGVCTGLCDEPTEASEGMPLPGCVAPRRAYCTGGDEPLVCGGECVGSVSLPGGIDICQASATAIGQLSAQCAAPIVQVYFAFNPMADTDTQQAFAQLVAQINDPLTTLLVLLTRLELLEQATAGLLAAAEGSVADRVEGGLDLDDSGLECAEESTDLAAPWLASQVDALSDLRQEIMEIASVLSMMMSM